VKYSIKPQPIIKIDPDCFRIEPIGFEDLEEVLGIENCSFPTPWNQRLFEEEINNPYSHIFLFKKAEGEKYSIIGYICLWRVKDEAHILKVAVHPFFRRKGVAQRLIQFTLEYLFQENIEKVILEVREHNHPARCLYDKFGFWQIGLRPHYYQDTGESALIMGLALKDFFRSQPVVGK